jgi:hypothetical protein
MSPIRNPGRWPEPAGPLRLALAASFGINGLDGAWRPYGTDLSREAAHLINQFPSGRGRVDRVACWPADWDVVEPFVFTDHGRIPVGELPPEYAHLMLCRIVGGPVIRLGVQFDWSPVLA